MNSQRIIQIISNPKTVTKQDAAEIRQLVDKYPYSAVLRVLEAKTNGILNIPDSNKNVTTAAIYITDRAVLKKYIENEKEIFPATETKIKKPENKAPVVRAKQINPIEQTGKGEAEKLILEPVKENKKQTLPLMSDTALNTLSAELQKNIEEYKKHKKAFDDIMDDNSIAILPDTKTQKKSKSKTIKASKSLDTKPKVSTLKAAKPKRKEAPKSKPKPASSLKKSKSESIEVQKTEETIKKPPFKKLKKEEQVEIIEHFIKTEPRITKVKSAKAVQRKTDLSIESSKFNDSIITENLAGIMIKQGKFDKAIDIYKRLIWKFPQKKTYFAAQIEELKKK